MDPWDSLSVPQYRLYDRYVYILRGTTLVVLQAWYLYSKTADLEPTLNVCIEKRYGQQIM